MKKKTILSILAVLLMTALFFSCAVTPPTGDGDGDGDGDTGPTGPDQIIITLVVPPAYEAELGASTLINLKIYGTTTKSVMVSRVDGKITVPATTYAGSEKSDSLIEILFWKQDQSAHYKNSIKPTVDTTIGGTKNVTVTLDTAG